MNLSISLHMLLAYLLFLGHKIMFQKEFGEVEIFLDVFGCKCFVHVPEDERCKLDVFFGVRPR